MVSEDSQSLKFAMYFSSLHRRSSSRSPHPLKEGVMPETDTLVTDRTSRVIFRKPEDRLRRSPHDAREQ
jgi:hypothetical protein